MFTVNNNVSSGYDQPSANELNKKSVGSEQEDKITNAAKESLNASADKNETKKRRLFKIQNDSGDSIEYSVNEEQHDMTGLEKLKNIGIDPVRKIYLHKSRQPVIVTLFDKITAYYITEADCVYLNARKVKQSENEEVVDAIWDNRKIMCSLEKVTHLTIKSQHLAPKSE